MDPTGQQLRHAADAGTQRVPQVQRLRQRRAAEDFQAASKSCEAGKQTCGVVGSTGAKVENQPVSEKMQGWPAARIRAPRSMPDAVAALKAWSPSPVSRASLWLHGITALSLAAQPQLWPFGLALLAGNHALLAALMHPRSTALGPNLVRLPAETSRAVAITFDDGPDPDVTPRVLDLLDAHNVTASFFVIGSKAERHKPLLREMHRRGHTIENHTYRHSNAFACLGPWSLMREIRRTQHVIADTVGVAPRFFRAPMGLRSPLLDPVLAMEGLCLVSWTRRGYDGRPHHPDKVLDRLTRRLASRDILLLHDVAPSGLAAGDAAVLKVLPRLLQRCAAQGLSVGSLAAVPAATPTRAASAGQ